MILLPEPESMQSQLGLSEKCMRLAKAAISTMLKALCTLDPDSETETLTNNVIHLAMDRLRP